MRSFTFLLPVLLGSMSMMVVACGQQSATNTNAPSPSPAPGTPPVREAVVNLYTSRHYDTDDRLYAGFTKATGIKVNVVEGKDDELVERLKNEGKNSPADVLIMVDVARLSRAQKGGLFQPLSSAVLTKAIPKNLRSTDNTWFGFSQRARVFVYNQKKIQPAELSTYEDLASPKWKGKICVRSSNNVYNQSLVASLLVKDGEAATKTWVQGLVSNFAREPEGGDTDQIKAVAAGQCDLAIVNHYYFARLKGSTKPEDQQVTANLAVFFPNQGKGGTHINISGAGLAAFAPHKDNGIKFLEYLATQEAQESFANDNYEFPVLAGLKPNPIVAAFGTFTPSSEDIAQFGDANGEAVKLMDEGGWK